MTIGNALTSKANTAQITHHTAIAVMGGKEKTMEIKACPFCGAEGAKFEATVGVISRVGSYAAKECQHMVVCQSCKATGPCKGTISRAVIAWNEALREEKLCKKQSRHGTK